MTPWGGGLKWSCKEKKKKKKKKKKVIYACRLEQAWIKPLCREEQCVLFSLASSCAVPLTWFALGCSKGKGPHVFC